MTIPEKGKYLMNKKFPKILTRGLYKSEKDGKELKQKKRNSRNCVFFVR